MSMICRDWLWDHGHQDLSRESKLGLESWCTGGEHTCKLMKQQWAHQEKKKKKNWQAVKTPPTSIKEERIPRAE
eukprot:1152633-Pelagomonas_calceolata.AAC.2